MKLVFLDTEATGIEVGSDRIVEVAYLVDGELRAAHFKPEKPMTVKAMSVTHITNRMLEGKPPFAGSDLQQDLRAHLEEGVMVAHNAAFDAEMLEAEGVPVPRFICTLKLARHLDSECEIPEYNLQYLRYHHGVEVDGTAHGAVVDVLVLEKVYAILAEQLTKKERVEGEKALERMMEISRQPSLIKRFTFGKYNGLRIADVAAQDPGYIDWLYGQKQSSPKDETDWIFTLERYRRR